MLEVKIHKIFENDPKKVKAIASVTIDGKFVVHGIRVVSGKNGDFVSMPSRKSDKEDKFFEVFHPISSEARQELSDAVLSKYVAENDA